MRGHKTIFDEDAELNEKWNPVVGYEGWYDVSDWGRVRRMKATSNTFVGRIIKPYANNKGYKCVGLLNGVEQKTVTVHRLVMAAFVGPYPEGKQVNHKDGDKTNNRLDNLEYVTPSENILHAIDTGLIVSCGESGTNSKLTNEIVYEIRRMAGKEKQKTIGLRFNVSQSCINKIVNRKTWRNLPEEQMTHEGVITDGQ